VSIRLRLTLWLTALLAVVLTGLTVLVYVVVSDQMQNRQDANLRDRAGELNVLPGPDQGGKGNRDRKECVAGENSTEIRRVQGNAIYFEILDRCGNVLVRSSNLDESLPISVSMLNRALKGKESFFDLTTHATGDLRVLGTTVGSDDRSENAAFVARSVSGLESDLFRLKMLLVGVVLGTTALSAVIGWFLAARAMAPVDEMTKAAKRIGFASDISGRIPVPEQQDEIGRLALTFNDMLERLQQAFATQRHFLADASHELRTPLTAIRANVETLRRGGEDDPAERDETLRIVEREVDRMGRLVDDLLALARSDAGQEPVITRMALDSLFLEVYHQQRPLAGRVRLQLGEFQPVEVDGDADRLKQLLLNLVDNALRYTPAGGSVTLDLLHGDHTATIRVRDTGPGIPPKHLPHIFERFYRIDSARTRQSGGTGLGLAISHEIVQAHGGQISVESTMGEGTTFTVQLPSPNPAVAQEAADENVALD